MGMSLRIYQNVEALNAHRQLAVNQSNLSKSIEKLSSGLRINRAGDDAAGLAISEKMRGQIRGLKQAQRNAQDGISLIQTAEGALQEVHSILQRMRELAVQAANDTNTDKDRQEIQKEINQLIQEIDRIAVNTQFNTKTLLDGNFNGNIHIGANAGQNLGLSIESMKTKDLGTDSGGGTPAKQATGSIDNKLVFTATATGAAGNGIEVKIIAPTDPGQEFGIDVSGTVITVTLATNTPEEGGSVEVETTLQQVVDEINNHNDAKTLVTASIGTEGGDGTGTAVAGSTTLSGGEDATSGSKLDGVKVDTQANANAAISNIQAAIDQVSAERSKLGAYQNRLEHTIANLGTSAENLAAAESRIRDVDMAAQMMEFTKNQILQQAGVAMLAQANMAPQAVLQLLR
jgi:flagellin